MTGRNIIMLFRNMGRLGSNLVIQGFNKPIRSLIIIIGNHCKLHDFLPMNTLSAAFGISSPRNFHSYRDTLCTRHDSILLHDISCWKIFQCIFSFIITVKSLWVWWRLKSPASRLFHVTVYSCADQRKPQSSAPLAFVRGIHRSSVINGQ